ncbi:MAG TPA: GatB/YqeY domain-containing protein [Patescibacteria group bacterium]|nr:GatB/YqeY domain-containing protein [Patescibacteria group bacterium]
MLKQRIDQDLKTALLSGNKVLATTLRGLKSAILYVEVAKGAREQGLGDDEIITILAKEAKKRQESADLYIQGGSQERAQAELDEKKAIEQYLPAQISDEELGRIVDEAIAEVGASGPQAMGQVIGLVKQKAGASADGARIANSVKERLK